MHRRLNEVGLGGATEMGVGMVAPHGIDFFQRG